MQPLAILKRFKATFCSLLEPEVVWRSAYKYLVGLFIDTERRLHSIKVMETYKNVGLFTILYNRETDLRILRKTLYIGDRKFCIAKKPFELLTKEEIISNNMAFPNEASKYASFELVFHESECEIIAHWFADFISVRFLHDTYTDMTVWDASMTFAFVSRESGSSFSGFGFNWTETAFLALKTSVDWWKGNIAWQLREFLKTRKWSPRKRKKSWEERLKHLARRRKKR